MAVIFFACLLVQSVAGWAAYDESRLQQLRDRIGWADYLLRPPSGRAYYRTGKSELLAVGSFAVLASYLRQRGFPERKPVGASHDAAGVEG